MVPPTTPRTVVVLAAGEGTRMRSSLPKVLHPLAGKPMLRRVLDVADALQARQVCVIVAPHAHSAIQAAGGPHYHYIPQHERRGTAHALLQALPAITATDGDIVVLFGDTPLLQADTVARVIADKLAHHATLGLLSFDVPAPHNYGRIVRNAAGQVVAIVEAKNCDDAQRLIREANSGIIVISWPWLRDALPRIQPDSISNEYYLTDLIAMAVNELGVGAVRAVTTSDLSDAWGVNDRSQLATAEALLHERTCHRLMLQGVTITNPALVTIEPEVVIAADCVIQPGSVLRGQTQIGAGCVIGPHATIDDSVVGAGCTILHSIVKQGTIAADTQLAPFSYIVGASAPL